MQPHQSLPYLQIQLVSPLGHVPEELNLLFRAGNGKEKSLKLILIYLFISLVYRFIRVICL